MKRRTATCVKMSTLPVNTTARQRINQMVNADFSGLSVYLCACGVRLLCCAFARAVRFRLGSVIGHIFLKSEP